LQPVAGKITVLPHASGRRRPTAWSIFCVYLLYRAALALITAAPVAPRLSLGNALGLVAWLLLPTYRQLARRNMDIAFGSEKSAPEKRRIVRPVIFSSSAPTSSAG